MTARSPRRPVSTAAQMERREWMIESNVQAIAPIVETVQTLCVAAGFSPRHCRLNIPVAITEALSNAILRGNASEMACRVHILVAVEAGRLMVEVTDEGDGFDLEASQRTPEDPDWLDREDGRGLFLMRALMDHVESRMPDAGRGHTLRLILHRV
ncbi:MAG: ATP-binding protein [Gemmatimonas sp.]